MNLLLQAPSGAFASWLLRASIEASLVAVLVMLGQFALRNRVSARWRYNLWLLVLARLALPVFPEARLSPFNWLKLDRNAPPSPAWVAQEHPVHPLPGDVIKPPTSKSAQPSAGSPASFVELENAPKINVQKRLNDAVQQQFQQQDPMPMPRRATPSRLEHRTSLSSSGIGGQSPANVASTSARWDWRIYLRLIWCIGASVAALWAIVTSVRLAWLVRHCRPIDDPRLHAILLRCCQEAGVRRAPRVLQAPPELAPSLVGYFRPRLLIPSLALRSLEPNELRLVLLHELVHLKRGDVAWNWVLALFQALHWFNPVLWWSFVRIRADRELACDEAVLAMCRRDGHCEDAREYGRAILKLVETFSGGAAPPAAVGVLDGQRTMRNTLMRRRITMIAQLHRSGSRWSVLGIALTLTISGVALTGAVNGQQAPQEEIAPPGGAPQVVAAGAAPAAPATQPAAQAQPGETPAGAAYGRGLGGSEPRPGTTAGGGFAGGTAFRPLENQPLSPYGGIGPAGVGAAPGQPFGNGGGFPRNQRAGGRVGAMPGGPAAMVGQPPANSAPINAHVEDPEAARADARTAEKLRKPLTASFDGVDLTEILQFVADQIDADVFIDTRAMETLTLIPVKVQIKQPLPADELLRLILRSAGGDDLGYAVAHGVVVITTADQLERSLVTRGYDVSDIQDPDSLIKAIVDTISPHSWKDMGGEAGSIRIIGQKMLVTNSEPRQREIAKLLALLRDNGGQGGNRRTSAAPPDPRIMQLHEDLVKYSQQLADASQQYDELRFRYGDKHPEVMTLKHRLESLKAGRDQTVKALSDLNASTPAPPAPGPQSNGAVGQGQFNVSC